MSTVRSEKRICSDGALKSCTVKLYMVRILITGSAGFVGHAITDFMINKGYSVVGLDRLNFSGDLNRIAAILKPETRHLYSVVHHDLRSTIGPLLAEKLGQFDYILHIAASSHVDRSISDPMSFVLDNVVGTCNILQFAREQTALKKFVYFSTDEVFGPAPNGILYDEYDRYNSTNPYSASKAGGEELCNAFRNTYKLPVVITHTMNVYGDRQHPEKFIPSCIQKIRKGEKVYIHSDETRTIPGSRFYIHTTDVARAIYFIMHLDTSETKLNIVGKQEVTNLQVAQYIADALDKHLEYEFVDFHSARPGHDLRYALSGKRLEALGWTPMISMKECITELVKDY